MKIYLVKRTDTWGYDDYDSLVVCADSHDDAMKIQPDGKEFKPYKYSGWVESLDHLTAEEIGEANENQERGLILASFNAG